MINNKQKLITIAGKLTIPQSTRAVLWDMDGVLIDSLGFDVIVVNRLLKKYFGRGIAVSPIYLKSIFAYDPLTFWQMILQKIGNKYKTAVNQELLRLILKEYGRMRQAATFKCCPGIPKILSALKKRDLKQVVVSNNPTSEVKVILKRAGIADRFDRIMGNDVGKSVAKKPAPDTYLFAIDKLGFAVLDCVIVEDTKVGIMAGKSAGCFTIGVATGGASKSQLQKMKPRADKIYSALS